MTSVFNELKKLRKDSLISILEAFPNRYTVLCQEPDKTKTAYCFSVPIRNIKTNNIVDLSFSHTKHTSKFVGSDATLIIDGKASLFNQHGKCDIIFQNSTSKKTKNMICLRTDNHYAEIYPTLNGMLLIMDNDWYEDQPNEHRGRFLVLSSSLVNRFEIYFTAYSSSSSSTTSDKWQENTICFTSNSYTAFAMP